MFLDVLVVSLPFSPLVSMRLPGVCSFVEHLKLRVVGARVLHHTSHETNGFLHGGATWSRFGEWYIVFLNDGFV